MGAHPAEYESRLVAFFSASVGGGFGLSHRRGGHRPRFRAGDRIDSRVGEARRDG